MSVAEAKLFQALQRSLPQVTLDGRSCWIAEGDLLLTAPELLAYTRERLEARRGQLVEGRELRKRLVVTVKDEETVRWPEGVTLRYALRRSSFSVGDRYEQVVARMAQAAGEWETACGVRFHHEADLDEAPEAPEGQSTSEVLFTVEEVDHFRKFIALAFFPDDPPARRRLRLERCYFSSDLVYDPVGVLRHELGHVLGFRHEQLQGDAPADCPKGDITKATAVTPYDPESVMHYFCGGRGSRELAITDLDREGARLVYGPALEGAARSPTPRS